MSADSWEPRWEMACLAATDGLKALVPVSDIPAPRPAQRILVTTNGVLAYLDPTIITFLMANSDEAIADLAQAVRSAIICGTVKRDSQ